MEHIEKYFTELDTNFQSIGKRVQIRVLLPFRNIPGGGDFKVDIARYEKGILVDILIRNECACKYTFHALDIDVEGEKLVMGARNNGKVVKTYFFDRNNGGKPVSKSGLAKIVDYEKAIDTHSIDNKKATVNRKNADTRSSVSLRERIISAFSEIGIKCYDASRFGTGGDDRVLVDFNRIAAILDLNLSKGQILLKGSGDVNWLCGMDERHPFVAIVPREAINVRSAHKMLRPEKLEERDDFRRQGEWFFIRDNVPVSQGNKKVIMEYELKRDSRSKPHAVEFALKRGKRIYARGWVEHEDHKALFLDGWHRVELNNEIVDKYAFNPD